MIPKVIHYCWFGRGPKPEKIQKCIDSWSKIMPDYEIKEWDEDNWDVRKHLYTSQAYDVKKYAFVSDYARYDILFNNGGIYLDTDVELLKSLDPIVQEGKPFGGLDSSSGWFTSGLGMGGPRHSKIFNLIRLDYCCSTAVDKFGKIRYNTNVSHEISIMSRLGIKRGSNEIQEVGGMVLYPKEYFCPIDFITNKINITDNTYSIHHYTCTWMPKEMIDDLIKRYPELKERYSNN